MLTDDEVYENRKKVIAFLKKPGRKKTKGYLDSGDGRRCCLGHMCYVLDIEKHNGYGYSSKSKYGYGELNDKTFAPNELIKKVGLWTHLGLPLKKENAEKELCFLNDELNWSPQEIGAYLESVIMGGRHTPWTPINPT